MMNMDDLEEVVSVFTGKTSEWLDNVLTITLGDGTRIHLDYELERDEVYLYCHVASLPPERFGSFAMELMQANLFGKDTGGSAVLAYDPEESRVVLWDKFELAHMTQDGFRERFSLLYLSRLHWSDKMRERVASQTAVPRHSRA